MPLAQGTTFAGYRILRMLGAGGMGEVYLAQHPRLPRRDALKLLPLEWSADPDYRARFNREADLASTLWHPHIVGVHDRGEHVGQLWISMDFVDGIDAGRLLRERYPGGMPADEVAKIVTAVASALDYANKQGLLHRDVKPANVMLTHVDEQGERRVLLTDFGIARNLDDVSGLTTTNMTVGTVAYSAPEQLMGEDIDGRADQYALAATAYHLLAGSTLFPNSNPAVVISRHLNSPAPRLSDKNPALAPLDTVLAAALSKRPEDRFARCSDFALAFTEQIGAEVTARPSAPTTPAQIPGTSSPGATSERQLAREPTKNRSSRRLLLAALVAATLLIGGALWAWRPWQQPYTGSNPSTHPQTTTPVLPTTSPTPPPQSTSSASALPPPPPTTSERPLCIKGEESAPVQQVVSRFTPGDIFPNAPADLTVITEGGNFDSCATLSAVFISIAEGTGSTPSLVLLFHEGSYVGPATPTPYAFTSLDTALTTDDTVVLKYGVPGSCNACPDMTFTIVRFKWDGDHVVKLGDPPSTGEY
ncbi:LppP/LprE family lipoprotein [Mycobacterium sp. 852002-51152_SCH6134967]|uniref:protein kinase domain-containing protein n=1 Tax=Mycobacterium sp. 852002-51152_SCH6134967 TaxID=1834096 RepID=UPI0009EDDA36|nr:LppP/LprE family lipoprotein [Mycobacterium sp. 852002-51152_SCH6134967]